MQYPRRGAPPLCPPSQWAEGRQPNPSSWQGRVEVHLPHPPLTRLSPVPQQIIAFAPVGAGLSFHCPGIRGHSRRQASPGPLILAPSLRNCLPDTVPQDPFDSTAPCSLGPFLPSPLPLLLASLCQGLVMVTPGVSRGTDPLKASVPSFASIHPLLPDPLAPASPPLSASPSELPPPSIDQFPGLPARPGHPR